MTAHNSYGDSGYGVMINIILSEITVQYLDQQTAAGNDKVIPTKTSVRTKGVQTIVFSTINQSRRNRNQNFCVSLSGHCKLSGLLVY